MQSLLRASHVELSWTSCRCCAVILLLQMFSLLFTSCPSLKSWDRLLYESGLAGPETMMDGVQKRNLAIIWWHTAARKHDTCLLWKALWAKQFVVHGSFCTFHCVPFVAASTKFSWRAKTSPAILSHLLCSVRKVEGLPVARDRREVLDDRVWVSTYRSVIMLPSAGKAPSFDKRKIMLCRREKPCPISWALLNCNFARSQQGNEVL